MDWKNDLPIQLPFVAAWAAWRGCRPPAEALHQVLIAAQHQSKGLVAQIEFLESNYKVTAGIKPNVMRNLTQFRFLHRELLCELRFAHGDITLNPTMVVVLDSQTPLGNHIIEHFAKSVHDQYAHASVRFVSWRLSKLFVVVGLKKIVTNVIHQCEHCQRKVRMLARRKGSFGEVSSGFPFS